MEMLHYKKKIYSTERLKKVPEISKSAQSLKKRIKKSTKPLKILPVYPGEEPSPTKPFLGVL